jgi:hypothetical protein
VPRTRRGRSWPGRHAKVDIPGELRFGWAGKARHGQPWSSCIRTRGLVYEFREDLVSREQLKA